jgi:hypothetical protein
MIIGRLVRASCITGAAVLIMAAIASASTVTHKAPEAAAMLTFMAEANMNSGLLSDANSANLAFAHTTAFACTTCSAQAIGADSLFAPLVLDLFTTDVAGSSAESFGPSAIIPASSGIVFEQSPEQRLVRSSADPEPPTLSLIGATLIAIGMFSRKRFFGAVKAFRREPNSARHGAQARSNCSTGRTALRRAGRAGFGVVPRPPAGGEFR